MTIKLRPDQIDFIAQVRASISKYNSVLCQYPTGGGKTVMFSEITRLAVNKGKRVLILTHRKEIAKQAISILEAINVHCGGVATWAIPKYGRSCQVAMVRTMAKRLKYFNSFDLIIADEAHHSPAAEWKKIIDHYPGAKLLGFTATPVRSDGKPLGKMFDDIIIGPSVGELIDLECLSNYKIIRPEHTADLSGVKRSKGDYNQRDLASAMDKSVITGDAVEYYKKYSDGLPAIAFCVSIVHAVHVAEKFTAAGYRAVAVSGKTESSVRKQAIEDLGSGKLDVLTSCDVVSEGTDIPNVNTAILLRPTLSLGLYLQQVGRALRFVQGKTAVIIDHVGNIAKHGKPDDIFDWSLNGTPQRRSKDDKIPQIKTCPACYKVHKPALICPRCGFEYEKKAREIAEAEGKLIEDAEHERQKIAKKAEIWQCKTLEELQELGKKRGYKPGWALHRWDNRKWK